MGVYHVRVTQNEGPTKREGTHRAARASMPEHFGGSIPPTRGAHCRPLDPRLASLRSGVVMILENPKIRALTQRRLWVSPFPPLPLCVPRERLGPRMKKPRLCRGLRVVAIRRNPPKWQGQDLNTPDSSGNQGVALQGGADSGALSGDSCPGGALPAPTDPDLLVVVNAWPTLPEPARQAILTIIREGC